MSEQKNSFLYIGEDGKADWGVPEGYPYYGEPVETVLVDNKTVSGNGIVNFYLEIKAGRKYCVTFDETVYECIGMELTGGITYIGNTSISEIISTDTDTGEPFLIIVGEGQTFIYLSDGGSHVISVSAIAPAVYPMSAEYLPVFNVFFNMEGETVTADKTYAEINNAIKNGMIVKASAATTGGTFVLSFIECLANYGRYQFVGYRPVYGNVRKDLVIVDIYDNENIEVDKLIASVGGLILPSSTTGSSKVFSITVNDSGTISAIETT